MIRETYKGCKIKVIKGREFGWTRVIVNGVDQGDHIESQERALESAKNTIDFALKVGVDSGRFGAHWYAPGTYELCEEGHAKPIGGECGHHRCVRQRQAPAA